jgi:hypothetical protein
MVIYLKKIPTAVTKAPKTTPKLVITTPKLQAKTTVLITTTKSKFPIFGIFTRQTTTLATLRTTTTRTKTAQPTKTTTAITTTANINSTSDLKNKFPLIKLWVGASNLVDIQNFYWTQFGDILNYTFWKEQDVQYDNQCVFLSK